jgi:sugar diacid utilization regulator
MKKAAFAGSLSFFDWVLFSGLYSAGCQCVGKVLAKYENQDHNNDNHNIISHLEFPFSIFYIVYLIENTVSISMFHRLYPILLYNMHKFSEKLVFNRIRKVYFPMKYDAVNQFVYLDDILRPLNPGEIIWLSGGDTAYRTEIRWVSGPREPIQPGDLVLIPPDEEPDDRIIKASAAGAAAVGIIGDNSRPTNLSDGLPVFILRPDPARAASPNGEGRNAIGIIHRSLLQSLLSQKTNFLELGGQIQTRLTRIAARDEGLSGLTAAMRDLSRHSILVQDKRLQILSASPTSPLRPVWEGLLEQLQQFSSLPDSLRDRRQAGETPAVFREALPGALERMIAPIVVGEVARGYLSIIGPADDLDSTDRLVAEQGALVCAIEMARAKAVRETEKRLHGDLLSALLHQTLSARDARLWAQNTGLDPEAHHAAVRMAWDSAGFSLRRLETLVNGEISRQKARAIVSPLSGEVICFCETPRDSARPTTALALAQSVIHRAAEENPDSIVRCGIGQSAAHLGRWQTSFRQAGQALDMARRLNEPKPLYYMDLSVYRLLLQIEDNPDLRAFPQETLGPVLAHENAAELLDTLEEYFAHNGNLSQTAGALFIHRNTLTYRMERIAEISGLDFNNPDTRLAAQLALRIHRMINVAAA